MKNLYKICLLEVVVITGLAHLTSGRLPLEDQPTFIPQGWKVAETVNFDNVDVGKLPTNWTGTKTGKGEPQWAVVPDDSAPSKPNVLKQSGVATYPVCIKEDTSIKDGYVEVKFKPISGMEDQAGGVIWRCKDANNYYVARANVNEDNVVLYKTVKGKRTSLDIVGRKGGYGVKEKVASGQWHTLRVEFTGNKFTVIFNGKKMFDVEDNTFPDTGKVGLWTKADSVTLFDDFSYGSVAAATSVNFDDTEVGKLPAHWTGTQTGAGNPKWAVVADDTAPSKPNVLKQSGVATYGLCIKDDTSLKDGFVEVKFKPVSGTSDQAGGLVWRLKDTDNYYVTRANAMGKNNLSIYHTIQGKRVAFKSVNVKVTLGEWHTLRVDFAGNKFIVTLDGTKAIEAMDDSFSDAGKVGVYTRSDSVTLFDDFGYGADEEAGEKGGEQVWTSDSDPVGSIPAGWRAAETNGKGNLGKWEVIKDDSSPSPPNVIALMQTKNTRGTFNLLIAEGTSYQDLELVVKVKAMTGKEDQGGGPIWRAKDANNYYISRWNPLENNLRIYYVKDGKRVQIANADVTLDPNAWHELEIEHVGTKITAGLDGKKLIEVEDKTFTEAGKIGLWTKADAATAFDNIKVKTANAGDEDDDDDKDANDDNDKDESKDK